MKELIRQQEYQSTGIYDDTRFPLPQPERQTGSV